MKVKKALKCNRKDNRKRTTTSIFRVGTLRRLRILQACTPMSSLTSFKSTSERQVARRPRQLQSKSLRTALKRFRQSRIGTQVVVGNSQARLHPIDSNSSASGRILPRRARWVTARWATQSHIEVAVQVVTVSVLTSKGGHRQPATAQKIPMAVKMTSLSQLATMRPKSR